MEVARVKSTTGIFTSATYPARFRHRRHRAAMAAGAVFEAVVVALEHRRELGFDVGEFEEFLVQLVIAALAVPLQSVTLTRRAPPFDDQTDSVGESLWGMRQIG